MWPQLPVSGSIQIDGIREQETEMGIKQIASSWWTMYDYNKPRNCEHHEYIILLNKYDLTWSTRCTTSKIALSNINVDRITFHIIHLTFITTDVISALPNAHQHLVLPFTTDLIHDILSRILLPNYSTQEMTRLSCLSRTIELGTVSL